MSARTIDWIQQTLRENGNMNAEFAKSVGFEHGFKGLTRRTNFRAALDEPLKPSYDAEHQEGAFRREMALAELEKLPEGSSPLRNLGRYDLNKALFFIHDADTLAEAESWARDELEDWRARDRMEPREDTPALNPPWYAYK